MKTKRKSKREIAFSVITVIILCTASFLLGVYSMNREGKTDNDTNNSVSSAENENNSTVPSTSTDSPSPVSTEKEDKIVYDDTMHGFQFSLPESWKGYSIQAEVWLGTAIDGENSGEVVEFGPKILIRHPDWTTDQPRQDIPIMIFTIDQWDIILKEEMAVGAAPIGPSKIGSNSKYVFALPARYNFAYEIGFEEVEEILNNNPIVSNESFE
ncbi:MAG: hypothetical protein ACYDEX_12285 [Mobilitalea sp.]